MTRPHLRPCPSCARHIRVNEAGCPFCKGGLTESFHAGPKPEPPAGRLTRAALFALGTSAMSLAPGCSSSSQPAYGAPSVNDDAGAQVTPDAAPVDAAAGIDAPVAEPAYGAPPVESLDAAEDHVSFAPLYGIAAH
jgi:hypothetical protein